MRKAIGVVITGFMLLIGVSTAQAAFIINGDGTVTDTATGLMWKRATEPTTMNWDTAMAHCDNLSFAGYDDWYLPPLDQLQTLWPKNTAAFPDTAASLYWSSSSLGSGDAWYVHFYNGYVGGSLKSSSYDVRAVRSGQSGSLGHLIISAPSGGSHWLSGEAQAITWDPAGLTGDVRISLSRDGGKTFAVIADTPAASGSFNWTVTGPETYNAVVKAEPLADPAKTATMGLFSITRDKPRIWIKAAKAGGTSAYTLTLNRTFPDGFTNTVQTTWTSSAPAVATVAGNTLTGVQNGWTQVSTTYLGQTYTKWVPVFTTLTAMEMEANNTAATANTMTAGTLYQAEFYSGDTDWFKFTLASNTYVDVGYLTASTTADMKIEVFDSSNVLMGSVTSTNGDTKVLSLGLNAGTYYVKVTAVGDIDQANPYVIGFQSHGTLPVKTQPLLNLGDSVQSAIYHLQDTSAFAFNLAQAGAIAAVFTPAGDFARYRLELRDANQTLIDQIECNNQMPVRFQRVYPAGAYTITVTPISDVDGASVFTFSVDATADQSEAEANDTAASATAFDLTKSMTGRLNSATDVDFYRFDLTSPRFVDLHFSCYLGKSFTIGIYKDADTNQIDGITAQGNQFLHMGLGVGRYYIKVSSGDADTVNFYTLTVGDSAQTNLEIESNNTIRAANAIEKDVVRQGRVYSAGDKDYFGFYLPETALFTVTFTPSTATGDYLVSIVDENDVMFTQKTSANGGAATINAYKNPGNYFIKIEPNGDIDQYLPYALTLGSTAAITGLKQLVSVTVAGTYGQMTQGTGQTLTATASYSDATSQTISSPIWSSLNTAVATVDGAGNVQAVSQGATSIVASHGGLSGKFDITVGAPTITYAQHHGNLIVVAGGGAAADNTLWPSTNYLSDLVYLRFKNRLFTDTDIHYLNPVAWHDIDGDGYDNAIVDDTSPTVAELGTAITNWAAAQSTDGPLYIYLIDHGGIDSFLVFPGQILTAQTLKGWLDSFQSATGRKVVVMIEACKSGSFTDDLAATNRIIVTATGNGDAYQQLNGRISFTQFFIDRLLTGDSVQAAYTKAMQNLANMGLPYNQMNPQLTGATLAATTRIGGDFAVAGLFPEITGKTPDGSITANANVTFWAQLADLSGIETVWAVVVPPNYIAPPPSADLQSPQVALPTVTLTDADKNGVYEAGYSDFAYSGNYRVTFYAKNATGNVTVSAPTTITVSGGLTTDTDGDGMPDSWEDSYAGLNKNVNDAAGDLDNDTLTNLQEYQHSTSPTNGDTDGDTMPDGWEVSHNLDPTRNDGAEDADGDGVTNLTEYTDNTDPQNNTSYVVHTAGIGGRVIATTLGYPAPVKNAVVMLQGTAYSVTTGQDGTFSLANVPLGTYTLKITAANFVQHSGQVTLTSSGLALGDITLSLATTAGVAGDASGNGTLGMEDAIWILQVITGVR